MVLALRSVFCTDLRTDSNFYFIHRYLISIYKRGGECVLSGMVDTLYEADYVRTLNG